MTPRQVLPTLLYVIYLLTLFNYYDTDFSLHYTHSLDHFRIQLEFIYTQPMYSRYQNMWVNKNENLRPFNVCYSFIRRLYRRRSCGGGSGSGGGHIFINHRQSNKRNIITLVSATRLTNETNTELN